MQQGLALVGVLIGSMALGGCATHPTPSPVAPVAQQKSAQAWKQRQQQLNRLVQWRLDGRVGVQIRDQSGSFGIDWLQRANNQYDITIKNPLTGSTMASIGSTGSQVTLRAPDGRVYRDSSAERLVAQQMKLNLPLDNLRYWARGLSVPNLPLERLVLDAAGRPELLQQAGWVVNYASYKSDAFDALPERLELDKASEQVKARLVARSWQTRY